MRLAGRPLLAVATVAGLAGCSGVGGVNGGPILTSSTGPGSTTIPSTGPATTTPSATGVATTLPSGGPTTPSTGAPSGLALGGDELGVTRVGAPFREGVAAVTAALGRPRGDPAPDTSCVGATDETTWGAFRLAAGDGKVSGWLSKSTTLATPAGVTVGTTVAVLRERYGARLRLVPPSPDGEDLFAVSGVNLGGSLTGAAPSDKVTSLFNGSCNPP